MKDVMTDAWRGVVFVGVVFSGAIVFAVAILGMGWLLPTLPSPFAEFLNRLGGAHWWVLAASNGLTALMWLVVVAATVACLAWCGRNMRLSDAEA